VADQEAQPVADVAEQQAHGEGRVPTGRVVHRAVDARDQHRRQGERQRVEPEQPRRVEHREERPDGGGDHDLDDAVHRPGDGVRAGDPVPPDQGRDRAEDSAVEEDADRGTQEGHREDVRDGDRAQPGRERDRGQQQRAEQVRDDHHPAPVPAVGEGTGEESEQEVRRRLAPGDQRGQRGVAAEAVDQDRQRDQGGDAAGTAEPACDQVAHELPVLEQPVGALRSGVG
jgi:hypothetical protein